MHRWLVLAGVVGCLASAASCRRAPEAREYRLTGQVLAVAPERNEITIRHEDIKGFMAGMTMPFTVKDAALLEGRTPGDLVDATLVVSDTSAHLSTLTKTGFQPLEEAPPDGGSLVLREGDLIGDAQLVDQDGATRPLVSFRGHRVVVTFVYSRCPIPDFCPLMNRHFATLQKAIRTEPALADVRLVTVTLDPEYDRPPILKALGSRFDADPAVWTFLTGPPAEVRQFAAQFGIYSEADPKDPAQIVHNLRTAVLRPDGRVARMHTGNDWTPSDLRADLASIPAAAP
jgi:protein SCO1/2